MALNVVQMLIPYRAEALKISDAWNHTVEADEQHPTALLFAALVEAIAALESLRMRPEVFFARLAIEGTLLFDKGDADVPAQLLLPAPPDPRLARVVFEPEVAEYMFGPTTPPPGIGHNGGPPMSGWDVT